ncbi:MAG TPA: C cytochrome precursor [Planctomycetaceae bacterium]|nr:C cytochrome precursor [Planctomycetaceae bacterium]
MESVASPQLVAVLTAVLLFVVIRLRWSGSTAAVAALLTSGVVYFVALRWNEIPAPVPEVEVQLPVRERSLVIRRPRQRLGDGYVSSSRCAECHPKNHASWHASYHRSMTQLASSKTALAPFDGVEVRVGDQHVELEVEGEQLWATMDDLDVPPAARPVRIKRPIVLSTGSHHMQIYWYATGQSRILGQLPIVYLTEDQRWIPADATLLAPPATEPVSNTGKWNESCVYCHSTHGRTAPTETGGVDTQAAEFGISCEACHGPGEAHIDFHRGQSVDDASDPIVNPATLSNRLSSQVCGACHGFTAALTFEEYQHDLLDGYRYRPGEDIAKTRLIEGLNEETRAHVGRSGGNQEIYFRERFWDDGMVRLLGREYNAMIASACYTEKQGGISCFSCHNMHQEEDDTRRVDQWADDQLKPAAVSDSACTQCHQATTYQATSHTHHLAESSGSRCYNCHMPHTAYGLLKSVRSHHIDRPGVPAELASGRPNACNLCHLDQTLQWTSDYLTRWYGAPAVELSKDQQTVSAAVLWMLTGDAGQRALAAVSMGRDAPREASGDDWMAPFLARLLEDPYVAVRYCAGRSLRKIDQFSDVEYDHVAPAQERAAVAERVLQAWTESSRTETATRAATLVDPAGKLRQSVFDRLGAQRDDTIVNLAE